MSVLRAVVDHFLLPAATAPRPAPARAEAAQQPHAAVGVLCPPRDAAALGVAVGAALAREHGARAVLVCSWGAPGRRPGPTMPATGTARGLARSLVARGLDAAASGRLVLVAVEDAAAAGRALAAAPGPTVLVVAGARDAAMDAVLRAQDHVLVADTGRRASQRSPRRGSQPTVSGRRGARCRPGLPGGCRPSARARRSTCAQSTGRRRSSCWRSCSPSSSGPWCSARRRAASVPPTSAAVRRTSRRWPVRERCTTASTGSSSRPRSPVARTHGTWSSPSTSRVGRTAALATARRNGFTDVRVTLPGRGLDGARAHPCDGPRSDHRGRRRGAGREDRRGGARAAGDRDGQRVRRRRRVPRPARGPPGQADAARRRAGVRPAWRPRRVPTA